METPEKKIVLYSEFMIPVTARIIGAVFFACGIPAVFQIPLIGCMFLVLGLLFWAFYNRVEFYPAKRELHKHIWCCFIPISVQKRYIEISHVSLTRIIMSTKAQLPGPRGMGPVITSSGSHQYNVYIIFGNEKELVYSDPDLKISKEKAIELALELEVKLFSAEKMPQVWVNPKTGEEKIAEFKKRK